MKIGTQIVYIPSHADSVQHPDVEFGFVVSDKGNHHFCRYWRKGQPGELRTTANSELTPTENIAIYHSVDQEVVEYWLEELGYLGPFDGEETGEQ